MASQLPGFTRCILYLFVCVCLFAVTEIITVLFSMADSKKATSAETFVLGKSKYSPVIVNIGMEYNENRFSSALLTLVTTFNDNEARRDIHTTLFQNWGALYPAVQPVLMVAPSQNTTRDRWSDVAQSNHWLIYNDPYTIKQIPTFKGMFAVMDTARYTTPFIGYANADILFDESLVWTLEAILRNTFEINNTKMMVTGRRTKPVNLTEIPDGRCLDCVTNISDHYNLDGPNALDYFIFSRAGFYWDRVPEMVVGKTGYDNWLVAICGKWNVTTINASKTVSAIHVKGTRGPHIPDVKTGDRQMNHNDLVEFNRFPWGLGRTYCIRLATKFVDKSQCTNHHNMTCIVALYDRKVGTACMDFYKIKDSHEHKPT